MILRTVLFFGISLFLGFVAIRLLWPREENKNSSTALQVSLGVGFGFAVVSFFQFFWLIIRGAWSPDLNWILAGSFFLGLLLWIRSVANPRIHSEPVFENEAARQVDQILSVYFYLFLALALVFSVFYFFQNPHGNWDAWSHWNLRARFAFRGGMGWNHAMHPDYWNPLNYPLFLPMTVTAGWGFLQRETVWIPGLIALAFTLATVFLLSSSLARLRSKGQGWLAGILLLGTPFFLMHGNSQYSDIPLGFFFLATFVLATLHDGEREGSSKFLVLAGLSAGLAAWNKNEGLLFIGCFAIARFLLVLIEKGWKSTLLEIVYFSLGLVPILSVVFYVKTQLYPPQTIFQTRNVPYTFSHFTDPVRIKTIASAYYHTFFQFGQWGLALPILMFLYLIWMGFQPSQELRWCTRRVFVALVLMLAGYFMVYLATPHKVEWLLGTSINRLFICLWPSVLFGFFLRIRTPEEALQTTAIAKTEISSRSKVKWGASQTVAGE